jgi:hypothetical protein
LKAQTLDLLQAGVSGLARVAVGTAVFSANSLVALVPIYQREGLFA